MHLIGATLTGLTGLNGLTVLRAENQQNYKTFSQRFACQWFGDAHAMILIIQVEDRTG